MNISKTPNVYLASKVAMTAAIAHGTDESTVVFPGMGVGVGKMDRKVSARQMLEAYLWAVNKVGLSFKTWKEAQEHHMCLCGIVGRDLEEG